MEMLSLDTLPIDFLGTYSVLQVTALEFQRSDVAGQVGGASLVLLLVHDDRVSLLVSQLLRGAPPFKSHSSITYVTCLCKSSAAAPGSTPKTP